MPTVSMVVPTNVFRQSLQWIQLSGPTLFAPVISQVCIHDKFWEVVFDGRLLKLRVEVSSSDSHAVGSQEPLLLGAAVRRTHMPASE